MYRSERQEPYQGIYRRGEQTQEHKYAGKHKIPGSFDDKSMQQNIHADLPVKAG